MCRRGSILYLPKFENFSGQVKDRLKFVEGFKMKSMGMRVPSIWQPFWLLEELQLHCGLKEKVSPYGLS